MAALNLRRLAVVTAVLAFSASARAAAPKAGSRPATKPVARPGVSPTVEAVLGCIGFTGLASNTARMTLHFVGPPQPKTAEDKGALALVEATHRPGDLFASVALVVSRLPAKVLRATVRFCRSRAGRAYTGILNAGADPAAWKQAKKKPAVVREARALVASTRVAQVARHETFLAVRNAAGARALVERARQAPNRTERERQMFTLTFRSTVADGVTRQLKGKVPDFDKALLQVTAAVFLHTPGARVRAMLRFFRSKAGKAVEIALLNGLETAMDQAWSRMEARFVSGRLPAVGGGKP